MPQCIDDTTASNRYFISLPSWLAVQTLANLVCGANGNQDEPRPTKAMMQAAVDMVTDVPFNLIGDPEIAALFGEIHIGWTIGQKQLVLMFFPNRGPLLHHYLRMPNAPSQHDIEDATADRLTRWLRWLRA